MKTRPAWCGNPARKPGKPNSPRSAPTTAPTGTWPPGRTPCGARATTTPSPSDNTWPNLRRKGGLGKDPERAENRAKQLTAIDPDWNCPWPLDWQRHHRVLTDLADADSTLPHIHPGVTFEGDDLGKWLARQARDWTQLSTEQQERLTGLGVTPAQRPSPAPAAKGTAKGQGKATTAFQRGVAALAQYIAREGADVPVPRGHLEPVVVEGQEQPVEHRLGVWISNTKTAATNSPSPSEPPSPNSASTGHDTDRG